MYIVHELAALLGIPFGDVIAEASTRHHVGVNNGMRVSHVTAEAIALALGKSL